MGWRIRLKLRGVQARLAKQPINFGPCERFIGHHIITGDGEP